MSNRESGRGPDRGRRNNNNNNNNNDDDAYLSNVLSRINRPGDDDHWQAVHLLLPSGAPLPAGALLLSQPRPQAEQSDRRSRDSRSRRSRSPSPDRSRGANRYHDDNRRTRTPPGRYRSSSRGDNRSKNRDYDRDREQARSRRDRERNRPRNADPENTCANCERQGHRAHECVGPVTALGYHQDVCVNCNKRGHAYGPKCPAWETNTPTDSANLLIWYRQHKPEAPSDVNLADLLQTLVDSGDEY